MAITETAKHFFGHGQTWLGGRTAGGLVDDPPRAVLGLHRAGDPGNGEILGVEAQRAVR